MLEYPPSFFPTRPLTPLTTGLTLSRNAVQPSSAARPGSVSDGRGPDLVQHPQPSAPGTQSSAIEKPLPVSRPMNSNGLATGDSSSLQSTSSGDAAKALVEAWQDAATHPAMASSDGGAASGGAVSFDGGPPTTAELELRAQLELATARCAALEEQNSVLWQVCVYQATSQKPPADSAHPMGAAASYVSW